MKKASIILPAELLTQDLCDVARFCFQSARKKYQIASILLVGTKRDVDRDITDYINVDLDHIQVSKVIISENNYAHDIGNNHWLSLPLTALHYPCLKQAEVVVAPLYRGASYFAIMAKQSRLLPQNLKFVHTIYQPETYRLRANMILPLDMQNLIDCDLERKCAQLSDELWVAHSALAEDCRDIFQLEKKQRIRAYEASKLSRRLSKPKGDHRPSLAFFAPLNLTYGFDVFCELVSQLNDKFERFIIVGPTKNSLRGMERGWKEKLTGAGDKVVFIQADEIENCLDQDIVWISPARCPIIPLGVLNNFQSSAAVLWSSGFSISNEAGGLPADIRKFREALNGANLYGALERPKAPEWGQKAFEGEYKRRDYSPISSITAIVLHHNRSEFIVDTLESIKRQSLKPTEVIIIDDGSREAEFEKMSVLAEALGLPNLKIHRIANSYPGFARNFAANLATSDSIVFVDDDNILSQDAFHYFAMALRNSDIALSFYQTFHTSVEQTKSDTKRQTHAFAGLLPSAGYFHNVLGNSSFMMRRKDFVQYGGFTHRYGVGLEDYEFLLRLLQDDNLSYTVIPKPLLYFRIHKDRIRLGHIDWSSSRRLQAGLWRLLETPQPRKVSSMVLTYARQMHELTQYQYISEKRPKFFRIKSVLLHQYIRPSLAKIYWLRRLVVGFTGGESRFAKVLERMLFK